MNKEIRFSAKDTGVSNAMNRLRADSKRLSEDLMRDAQASTSSQKEAIKYYEDQIKLIERRNKLDRDQQKMELRDRYEQAASQKGANKEGLRSKLDAGMSGINKEYETGRMQVQLLRELIDATKQTSRDEVQHESKENVKDRMHQERLTKETKENETQADGGAGWMKGVRTAAGLSTALGQGQGGGRGLLNTISGGLMMSDSKVGGIVGLIIKGVTDAAMAVSNERKAIHESAMLTGQYSSNMIKGYFGYGGSNRIEEMGLGRDEYLQRYSQSVRSYGKPISEEQAVRDIQAEKALGLDQGIVNSMQRLTRTMSQFTEVQQVTNEVHRAMYGTGALGTDNMDMARMRDIVGTAVSMQSERFQRTGLNTGFESRLQLMRGLEGFGGSFKDDQYKQATLQQLESGVATMPNKMVHAMKLRKAREIAPGQNPFELFATIQSGDPRLIAPLIEEMAGSTQDDTLLMQRMYDMFGGSLSPQNVVAITQGVRQGKNIADLLPGKTGQQVMSAQQYASRTQEGQDQVVAEATKLWNDTTALAVKSLVELTEVVNGLTQALK